MSNKFDAAQLAYEIALGYHSPADLCLKFGIDAPLFEALQADPRFQRAVLAAKRQIDDMGTEFQVKARKLASLVVEELGSIALNPLATPGDRISAIRELARFAGYSAMAENPVQKPALPAPAMPSDDEGAREYLLNMLSDIVRNADGRSNPAERMNAMKEIARLKGLVTDTPVAVNTYVAVVPQKAQDTTEWINQTRPQQAISLNG